MAGNYPDVPGHRMAYDRDGTLMLSWDSVNTTVVQHSVADKQRLNDEDDDYVAWSDPGDYYTRWITFLFPELRDLVAYWARISSSDGPGSLRNFLPENIYTSPDTTNGVDGTWTNRGAWGYDLRTVAIDPAYRENIDTLSVSGVKAVKFQWTTNDWFDSHRWANCHLYGSPSSGEAPNRLRFWHPTSDIEVAGYHFDLGDVARGATYDKTFRIKNPSASLTANDVTLSVEAMTDTTPTNVSQMEFSSDGVNFSSTLNIGDLAPGATSGVITVRRNVASNAVLSLWATRIVASAASYT